MISFKQFLSEDKSKTKSISAAQAIEWMEANAKSYLKNGIYLYRGFQNDAIQLGNSEDFTRKSIDNSPNYYTMWIDNNPAFKDFPKRSKSFICTTSAIKAKGYGDVFFVIPKDQNKAGYANVGDIWNVPVTHEVDLARLERLTKFILEVFGVTEIDSYQEFEKSLKNISTEEIATKHKLAIALNTLINSTKKKSETLFDVWSQLVPPSLFNSEVASNLPNKDGEVWIQGECLFIEAPVHLFPTISQSDRESILTWADSYPAFKKHLSRYWVQPK